MKFYFRGEFFKFCENPISFLEYWHRAKGSCRGNFSKKKKIERHEKDQRPPIIWVYFKRIHNKSH